jgi:hypothetical protein
LFDGVESHPGLFAVCTIDLRHLFLDEFQPTVSGAQVLDAGFFQPFQAIGGLERTGRIAGQLIQIGKELTKSHNGGM